MVRITYIEANGDEAVVDARPGQSVMEAAVKNGVRGVVAECGGNCACATCRIYVDPAWREKTGEATPMELDMIEYSGDAERDVRLACQIRVSDELDGLVVRLPASQH